MWSEMVNRVFSFFLLSSRMCRYVNSEGEGEGKGEGDDEWMTARSEQRRNVCE
jgi:hypothetical protein